MRLFFLLANGISLTAFAVCHFFTSWNFNFGVFTGLLIGNACSVLNFYLLGYTAGKAIRRKNPRKARSYFRFGYAARYLTMFTLFGLLITLKLVNPVAVAVPLLFPSFHYKFKAIFNKEV